MQDSLRLFSAMQKHVRRFLPQERITRVRNLTLLVTGVFLSRSVHLSHIVRTWPVPSKISSLSNRLRRFLSNPHVEPFRYFEPVASMLLQRFATTQVRLLLDVTQVGPWHRMLTVSIAYRRRALPLRWSLHRGTRGAVSNEATLKLLGHIAPMVPASSSVVVVGDSAFGQPAIMQWLTRRRWDFVLRLRGSFLVETAGYRASDAGPGGSAPTSPGSTSPGSTSPESATAPESAWRPVRTFAPDEGKTCFAGPVRFSQTHALDGVYLVTHWATGEDEPWYLMSSRQVCAETLRLYRIRMWTEEFYRDLKGQGFDLEATQIECKERLARLVLGVFLAYVWLIALGSAVVKRGLRHVVDRPDRRDKSYFRIGWDYVEHQLRLGKPISVRFRPLL